MLRQFYFLSNARNCQTKLLTTLKAKLLACVIQRVLKIWLKIGEKPFTLSTIAA
jgi:hypothetical protein